METRARIENWCPIENARSTWKWKYKIQPDEPVERAEHLAKGFRWRGALQHVRRLGQGTRVGTRAWRLFEVCIWRTCAQGFRRTWEAPAWKGGLKAYYPKRIQLSAYRLESPNQIWGLESPLGLTTSFLPCVYFMCVSSSFELQMQLYIFISFVSGHSSELWFFWYHFALIHPPGRQPWAAGT